MTIKEIGYCGAYCRTCIEQKKRSTPVKELVVVASWGMDQARGI
jgi:hypothetical protein